ncbi:MAG: hypothetical protein K6E99_02855 [Bacilli bacterium]|nr:hypothetical protein [Bacilli bacterium]
MNRGAIKGKELIYFILVPVGVFLFSVAFDAINNVYWQKKLDNATEVILKDALKAEAVDTVEEYVEFAKRRYEDAKFDNNEIKVTFMTDENHSVLLSDMYEHFSIYGYVTGQKQYVTSRYKGYIDEYNEAQVEKLQEVFEDDKVEEETD